MDAHEPTPADYDEIPELDDEFFEQADLYHGGALVRRGRPKSDRPKVAISIRLSEEVVTRFRASGPGWQSRIDAALKEWLAQHPGIL
ncbi:MAG TPA: BrnA antitoxin family protein [Beijerinckiaceae bacterium]